MAFLKEDNYKNLARILLERVGQDEFFNGAILLEGEGITITLRVTLLVYREKSGVVISRAAIPPEITPVCWECETVEDGKVVPNDFSWSELVKFLPLREANRK